MLKRLIGISAALSLLVVASAADATSPAQRFSAHSAVRQQAPKARVTVRRTPSFRRHKPMSQQVERPDVVRRMQLAGSGAEMRRSMLPRVEFMRMRHETRCVPSKTCGTAADRPRAERPKDRKATKRQLAKNKSSGSTKF